MALVGNATAGGGLVTAAVAQTPPSIQDLSRIQDQIIRQEQQGTDRLERAKQPDRPTVLGGPNAPPASAAAPQARNDKGQPCFKITEVAISGHEIVGPPPLGWDRLKAHCATVVHLSDLLNDLNVAYQKDGWLTTRAYYPQQDLKSGKLVINVVPGRAASFDYGADKPADRRVAAAFPNAPGDLLNLRDLEQGLENFNGIASQSAKFQLFPGEEPGQSIVRLTEKSAKPWRVGSSLDNTGVKTTGIYKAKISAGIDNLINANDVFAFSVATNIDRKSNLPPRLYPLQRDDGKHTEAVNFSYKVPVGNWSFFVAGDASKYFFITPGNSQDYDVKGRSVSLSGGAERLLFRDQTSKLYAFTDLTGKRGNNFIVGFEIESQRRALTVAQLGLRGVKYLPDSAELTWSVATKFNLAILGAEPPVSAVVAEKFAVALANARYKRPVFGKAFDYTLTVSGQWSGQELPPSEQFSVGGRGTVRGFQEDSLYGNRGAFVRNELSRTIVEMPNFKMAAYAGIDAGRISFPATKTWDGHGVVGSTLGVRGKVTDYFDFDIAYARSLLRPEDFKAKRDLLYFTITAAY